MQIWAPLENSLPLPDISPRGVRTPSGLVWALSREGFYKVEDKDGCWSESMIKEFNNGKDDGRSAGGLRNDSTPRVVQPWGVLKYQKSIQKQDDARRYAEMNASDTDASARVGQVLAEARDTVTLGVQCSVLKSSAKDPRGDLDDPNSEKMHTDAEDSGIDMSYDTKSGTSSIVPSTYLAKPTLYSVEQNMNDHTLPCGEANLAHDIIASIDITKRIFHHRRDSGVDMSADDELMGELEGCDSTIDAPQGRSEGPPTITTSTDILSLPKTIVVDEPEPLLEQLEDHTQQVPATQQLMTTNDIPQKHEMTLMLGVETQQDAASINTQQEGDIEEKEGTGTIACLRANNGCDKVEDELPKPNSEMGNPNAKAENVCKEEPNTVNKPVQVKEADLQPADLAAIGSKHHQAGPDATFPKLAEFLPLEHLPQALIVNDPDGRTSGSYPSLHPTALKYKHFFPPTQRGPMKKPIDHLPFFPTDKPTPSVAAYLDLNVPVLGEGSHACAYQAVLRLPEPLASSGPVIVAAKICESSFSTDDLDMLYNEGQIYSRCPQHLQEDWIGFNHLEETEYHERDGVFPALAVVPKFYGFYVPVEDDEEEVEGRDKSYLVGLWQQRRLSPILLVEECGKPIIRANLRGEDRALLLSFTSRLFHVDMYQGSFYTRNILRQPGPLHVPPEQRSEETPSFRLINFGRGRFKDNWCDFQDEFNSWASYRTEAFRQSRNAIFGYTGGDGCRPYW